MNFTELGLKEALSRACESLGYTEPTPIQRQAIPVILKGADLIGCAETGTGKTAAFLLPILQRIGETQAKGVRVLILAPTRELALQIETNYFELAPKRGARCVSIIGGASMGRQLEALRRGAAIVIATPGRLLDLLERERFERVLVFTRTRRGAERLSHILRAREHKVNRIHADRTQPQREQALRDFKEGHTRVLVATDIAARGIDVDSISHVINYDVPTAPEDYVHRIGRTGRAGKQGRAITLVTPVDELSMRAIERLTGQAVERVLLPGFGGAGQVSAAAGPSPVKRRAAVGRRSFR